MRIADIINLALAEDIGTGDLTTIYLDLEAAHTSAYMIAKAPGIIAGSEIARKVFKTVDPELKVTLYRKDGDSVQPKDEIMKIEGKAASILQGERVALNFIQRLSGIATKTHELVQLLAGSNARLLDTRKTTPLLRELEKYAVRVGGGFNHRFGLYDMILLKENHIRAAGGIAEAVRRVKLHNTSYKIECEVTTPEELDEAVKAGVDRVMLDNMSIPKMKAAARKYAKKIELEASGGVTEKTISAIAATGVHFISVGALTHSYKSLDISLLF
ncbi:MAG TPA: carboxylating nicotinate-nucleotide diphosphorylase [Candidatus Cloacimonadota bacterium]|nr:carboxylating nicotinate-nucleotide diphosphorylase [Candidatus Cloacimonadota bacterium]